MVIGQIQQHKCSNIHLFLIYATCFCYQLAGDLMMVETCRVYKK